MSIIIIISDAEPIIDSKLSAPDWYGSSTLSFFALDDVGCSGSASNLLDCLPHSNCGMDRGTNENAGVQCLRRGNEAKKILLTACDKITRFHWPVLGVKLEYGPNQESNNTLITMNGTQEEQKVIFCSTDTKNDELNIPGSWFLPNGSKISSATTHTQSLHIALGNQTVGLNITNRAELPRGIYHCEMMDRENVTHHLYAGIYHEDEGTYVIKIKN